ncbi:hypothetical protein GQ43DRAFT_479225 [Delitschia confertaspora ATCC 74209]|uniref:Uncharacterized protein n=1 Tax=Delitschia confertaspora ATCC 74209 TaxID=1513339 RepID=A0A9P4JQA6_9PLEO|nr:hypothetical protein GQ43DRAFT_479225 [Delitschia confertaspora ATCC 74209]
MGQAVASVVRDIKGRDLYGRAPFVGPDLEGFDAHHQAFTLIRQNGSELMTTMDDMNFYRLYGIKLGINYATQIGASCILLLVLLLLTRREKRISLLFVMNVLCIVTNIIRSVLQVLWLTGEYYHPYALLANDYSKVPSGTVAISVAAGVMTLFLVICIMISLSLQVRVVCITTPRYQRFWIMVVTSAVALVAIAVRFAVTVFNAQNSIYKIYFFKYQWLVNAQTITQVVAIWFFSVVFTTKLGYAIIQRRKLGMRQFGPMQIIFIMGCQTMILPAIFSCLQFLPQGYEYGSWTLTLVTIFLPVSAIWASVIVNDTNLAATGPDSHHRLLAGQFGRSATNTSRMSKGTALGSMTPSMKDPESPLFRKDRIQVDREWTLEDEIHVDAIQHV